MAEHSEEALFREINDELRQESVAKIWKTYGSYILGVAVLVIVVVAGYQGWKTYDTHHREKYGENLHAAFTLAAQGKTDAAITGLKALSEKAGSGYAMIARFKEAALLLKKKDAQGALALYDRLGADTSLDPLYRHIAVIEGALAAMNLPGTDADAVMKRLHPIEAADNPLRFTAQEVSAAYYLKKGDPKKALDLFNAIATDASAPQSLRARAGELAAALAPN